MKHQWAVIDDTQDKVSKYGWEPMRICKICGATQQIYREQSWGRVTSRRWLPLVGKCKLSLKGNKK
jgi:hypothetical protein